MILQIIKKVFGLDDKIDIMASNWTDVVFSDKNKNYGAYFLRKIYSDHITRGAIISMIVFTVGISGPKIYDWIAGNISGFNKVKVTEVTELMAPPPLDKTEPPPPPPEAPPPPPLKSTVKFVAPEIVEDKDVNEEPPPTVDELKDADVGKKTEEGDPNGVDNSLVDDGPKVIDETPQIFSIVEQMPAFPTGGEEGFIKFIAQNFRYPAMERENNIQGTVFIEFVVRPDGAVTDVKVLKGVSGGQGLDKEAVRVVSSSPKWKPGKQNGKEVAVYYRVPVRCTLR